MATDPATQIHSSDTRIGGEYLAAMLAAEGVDTVFGIVDGTYLGFYTAFAKYGIQFISPRHETSAAHMAGAYARSTGKLGVCMASNGPGVANILPGIAVENAEGNRVLLITSCRRTGIAYPDRGGTFQYFDQVGTIGAMAKWSAAVSYPDRLPELARHALRAAWTGRPGVVHLDVPENIFNTAFPYPVGAMPLPSSYRPTSPMPVDAGQVVAAADLLRDADFPVIHAGSGIVHAHAATQLETLAEMLCAPVTASWGARGVLNEESRLSIPNSTLATASQARGHSDLFLVLGSRMGETDWWGRGHHWGGSSPAIAKRCIQVDIDGQIIGANRPVDLAIVGDVTLFLQAVIDELHAVPVSAAKLEQREKLVATLVQEKATARSELDAALADTSTPMHPAHVPTIARKVFGEDGMLVIDGGNTAVWCAHYYRNARPDAIYSTFKFGMLGAGVGQALGLKVAHPERSVVCIIGDGAMAMHLQEIETAVRDQLAVVYIVLCDRQWGMVKLTQQFGIGDMRAAMGITDEGTINADFSEVQFDLVATAMGAYGVRVADPGQLEAVLRDTVALGKPAVVHVDVNPQAHLWAPNLLEFKEMHGEPVG
jgi:acetolactate synthase-1/2/3 large subunit